jgi:hypothetical protein
VSNYNFVVPFERELIGRFNAASLIVKLEDFNELPEVVRVVTERNRLHSIRVETQLPLSEIPFDESWGSLPLVIHLSELGPIRELPAHLKVLRHPNTRIFFPADRKESTFQARILSSLGVCTGIHFRVPKVDWDSVNDLMHYSIYSRTRHAPVEPFHHIVSNYHPGHLSSHSNIDLDNPEQFLHVDRSGRLAFSRQRLEAGKFLEETLADLDEAALAKRYKDVFEAWKPIFLKADGCATCEGWRLCRGRHLPADGVLGDSPGCQSFYADLLEACDFVRDNRAKQGVQTWQF